MQMIPRKNYPHRTNTPEKDQKGKKNHKKKPKQKKPTTTSHTNIEKRKEKDQCKEDF